MRRAGAIPQKIFTLPQLLKILAGWRINDKKVAFANGVFDILHEGHIFSLSQAAAEADVLVVAINSDASVKRLKGPERPVNNEAARALIMASLVMVDAVIIFEEDTPLELIKAIIPNVLVKGGDYRAEQIAGAAEVVEAGGKVVINTLIEGVSTTGIIEKMRNK